MDPGGPRVGGCRRVAERRRRAGGGAHRDGDPRAAAIELVSPRNKDRTRAREAFAAKCAEDLGHGCGVVVVDVVTTRRADLQADLLAMLGADPAVEASGTLSAVSYQPVVRDCHGQLLAWPAALEVGRPLPTVPLWLGEDLACRWTWKPATPRRASSNT